MAFKWSTKRLPSVINTGGNISLQWTYILTQHEQKQAQLFSLITIDKERYLYGNEWITLAVKAPLGGFYHPVVRSPLIQLTQDQGVGLVIYNVTSRSETRYRCTFISGFPAPRSIVTPNIKGKKNKPEDQSTSLFLSSSSLLLSLSRALSPFFRPYFPFLSFSLLIKVHKIYG